MDQEAFTRDCPAVETLSQLIDGTVEDAETLEEHLQKCEHCRQQLDDLSQSEILRPFRRHESLHPSSDYSFLEDPVRNGDLGSIGEFYIESEIGRGGAGIVFKAYDATLERFVAVKVLNNEGSFRSDARFERESKVAGNLRSDYLVHVYSASRTTSGRPFLVMPLIQGQTLKAKLNGDLPTSLQSARIIRQISLGLAAVHDAGLVHRDVKSANILLDDIDGRAKLTDFGLARGELSDVTLTQADVLCGTPEYMSPEQVAGEVATSSSDIYGLGITLYEYLTGTTPFRGQPLQVLRNHQQTEPIRPARLNPSVATDLETICLKSISKLAEHRYRSATELADDLKRFLDGRPILARPVSPLQKLKLWAGRNPTMAGLAASTLILLLALAIGSTVVAWRFGVANKTILNEKQKAIAAEENALQDRSVAIDSLSTLVDSLYDELSGSAATIKTREKVVTAAINGLESITEVAGDRKADRTTYRAYLRIGDLTSLRGAHDEAVENYSKAIQWSRDLLTRDPSDAAAKHDLAHALSRLSVHYFGLGDDRATELNDESMGLLNELLIENPDDVEARTDLVIQHGHQLNIMRSQAPNNRAQIIKYGESALQDVDLLMNQPAVSSKACEAANSIHFAIGRAWLEGYQPEKANEHFTAARRFLDQSLQQSPENIKLMAASAVLDRAQAMVMGSLGNLPQSVELFENALAVMKQLSVLNPDDRMQKRNIANTQNIMSTAINASGRQQDAIDLLEEALAIYRTLQEESPEDEATQVLIVDSLFKKAGMQGRLNRWSDAHQSLTEIEKELDGFEFGQANAFAVNFYRTQTAVSKEAVARLTGKTATSRTTTGECLALMMAVRQDAQTATSFDLSEKMTSIVAMVSPEFKGTSFEELFAYLDNLKEVSHFVAAQRKQCELSVYGLLAENLADAKPENDKLSATALGRCLEIAEDLAESSNGREYIATNPDLKWMRNTPEFQDLWAKVDAAN